VTDEERNELAARWAELNKELAELLEGKVQPAGTDPAAREDDLHAELDEIEHLLGLDYLERIRRERSKP
jgi:hypothetical protein